MAGTRRPVGYIVRRPLTLWGKRREIGEYLPANEVKSMVRLESMVRSGRFNPVYEEGGMTIERKRGSMRAVDKTPIPVDTTTELDEVVEEVKPVKRAAKKAAPKKESTDA
jgi:hypothetical protein